MTPTVDPNATVITPSMATQNSPAGTNTDGEDDEHLAMPKGTRLAEFEITRLIGVGGFGIVYLAHDASLGRDVALKEYMPSSLAFRKDGTTVMPKSSGSSEAFLAGLRSFINEARMLALFDHPSLVKVYRFWEANGTAYMVMQYCQGQTLKKALATMIEPPSEQWLTNMLNPLVDALQVIHDKHCFHRDISPDNIFLLNNGQPVLLDFGAARQVIGNMVNNLTVILKPGYAPIEQYAGDPNMPQGPWTDIYALGAVLHFAITGNPPNVSVGRLVKDNLVPLERTGHGHYSAGFLRCIDHMLGVRQDQRPQSIAELKELLLDNSASSGPNVEPSPPVKVGPNEANVPSLQPNTVSLMPATANGRRVTLLWVGAFFAALTIGLGSYLLIGRERPPPVLTATSQQKTAQEPATSVSMPPLPMVAPVAPAVPVSATRASEMTHAFDPGLLLDQVYQQRDTSHMVTIGLDKSRLVIGKDSFRFRVKSTQGGFVYVLMLNSNKGLNLLFPNALDSNNRVKAHRELSLPGPKWQMSFEGPAGIDQFVVLVSEKARNFQNAGLIKTGGFGEFPLDAVQRLNQTANGNLLSGEPVCPVAGQCSSAYGAAKFSIEEVN